VSIQPLAAIPNKQFFFIAQYRAAQGRTVRVPQALQYDSVLPVVAMSTMSGQDLLVCYLHGRLLLLQAHHEPPNVWVMLVDGVAKADAPPFAVIVCAQILMAYIPRGRWQSGTSDLDGSRHVFHVS